MAQGTDFKGRSLLTKTLVADPVTNPEKAQAVQAVVLVDSTGAPVTLAGSTVELDPPGPYSKLIDDVDGVVYIGEAVPGTPTSSAAWRISKVTTVGEDISKLWAAGTARFTQVWDDRLTLSYA